MNTFLVLLLVGISLSMDVFALSIFLGTISTKKRSIFFSLFVGMFHFIMPIIGAVVGFKLTNIITLNGEFIFGIILLLLSIQIFINIFKKENPDYKISYYELILLAFSVSLDSFTIGFGLSISDSYTLYSSLVFSICSVTFAYLGLLIGKYFNEKIGVYSKVIGAFILFIFALIHLL